MTIESTSSFNETADQIILNALIILKIYSPADTLQASDEALGLNFLNLLVKHWEGLGIHIWTTAFATVWLQQGQQVYSLGSKTTDAFWANTYTETTTTTSYSNTTTTLALGKSLTTLLNDNIGVQGSDGNMYWSTISVASTGTMATINGFASMPSTVTIPSGAYVYTFTARPVKPLQIQSASRRSGLLQSTVDVIMPSISYYDYELLTNKFYQGTPLQWKLHPNTGSSLLTVWPVPNDVTQRIHIQYLRPLFDFTVGTDNPDIPQEWLLTLTYGLAAIMAPAYGKVASAGALMQVAESMLEGLDGYDREKTSLYFEPSKYRY